jgi:predicted unusual protein kinase regulating ubiquinone biosynthesis (AarF/ABC1/UbiB family)
MCVRVQVYKARLQETGDLVAVKVQRPGVLEGISRDLFLLRTSAKVFQFIPLIQSDLVGLLDTWALRFFDELDYVQEVISLSLSLSVACLNVTDDNYMSKPYFKKSSISKALRSCYSCVFLYLQCIIC